MTIPDRILDTLQGALTGLQLPDTSLDQAIAIGIQGEGSNTWLTLIVQDSCVVLVQTASLSSDVEADDFLGVKTAILASSETWLSIAEGGEDRVIQAADKRELEVSGQLSFFIRHVRSIVSLLEKFGRILLIAQ